MSKMKTSSSQFRTMVEFMEKNGDLSKFIPAGGGGNRKWCISKWLELVSKLNSDITGDAKSDEKWRKVWRDYKNLTKKKFAKMRRSAENSDGGMTLKMGLTDLEQRVLAIMDERATAGTTMPVVLIEQDPLCSYSIITEESEEDMETAQIVTIDENDIAEDWKPLTHDLRKTTPSPVSGTSRSPTQSTATRWKPQKEYEEAAAAKALKESEEKARKYEREKEDRNFYLEKERIRQRDRELDLQTQWLQFLKDGLGILKVMFVDGKKRYD